MTALSPARLRWVKSDWNRTVAAGQKTFELGKPPRASLTTLTCEPIPISAAFHYAQIKFQAQRGGRAFDENDLWIVATAYP